MREVKKMKKDRIKFMLDVQKWKQMSMEDLANHIPVVIMAAAVLAGIIAYVLYIVNGGYSAQIADIKEYGFLSDRMFTTGTTDLVLGGIAGNIILLLLLAEFVVLSLAYCRICEEGKKTALIASGVLKSNGGAEGSSGFDFQFSRSHYVCKTCRNYLYHSHSGSAACFLGIAFDRKGKQGNGYFYDRSNGICKNCSSACCMVFGKYPCIGCCCSWRRFELSL